MQYLGLIGEWVIVYLGNDKPKQLPVTFKYLNYSLCFIYILLNKLMSFANLIIIYLIIIIKIIIILSFSVLLQLIIIYKLSLLSYLEISVLFYYFVPINLHRSCGWVDSTLGWSSIGYWFDPTSMGNSFMLSSTVSRHLIRITIINKSCWKLIYVNVSFGEFLIDLFHIPRTNTANAWRCTVAPSNSYGPFRR